MEAPLGRSDRLHHWPLVINWIFSPFTLPGAESPNPLFLSCLSSDVPRPEATWGCQPSPTNQHTKRSTSKIVGILRVAHQEQWGPNTYFMGLRV
jgi:hypothetical protein